MRSAMALQIARYMLKTLYSLFALEQNKPRPEIKCRWLNELHNLNSANPGQQTITFQGGSVLCPTGICKWPMCCYDNAIKKLSGKLDSRNYIKRNWQQCRVDLLNRSQQALPAEDNDLMHDSLVAVRGQMRKICALVEQLKQSTAIPVNDIRKLEAWVLQLTSNIRLIIESFDLQKDFLRYMK